MPATSDPIEKLLGLAAAFVVKQKGAWDHAEWEAFCQKASATGFDLTEDEGKRNLGNILEAAKFFYGCAPTCCAPAKAAPKKKAAAKK